MENEENLKPWHHWALLGWMVVVPSVVLSLALVLVGDFPWFYAVPMAFALSMMAWVGILKAVFS
ncbi:MAG TPA: hypothetical protein VGN15_06260 [Ktedonobacteraceae bacterium]|jgi:hypothetical protein|nr:hypothetical protein [Ktedonobacteraceae bacterium]